MPSAGNAVLTLSVIRATAHGRARGDSAPDTIGGKALGLVRLAEAGMAVPPWFVIGTAAFDTLVAHNASSHPESGMAARREAIRSIPLPDSLRAEVLAAVDDAGLRDTPLAVRSSAVGEDAAGASFAGQFESVLGVRLARHASYGEGESGRPDEEDLWDAVRQVWASALHPRAAAYRDLRGSDGTAKAREPAPVRMAVIIQAMIDAEASGVAFSADPVTGDRTTAIINAVYGLAEPLVSGESDADSYRVGAAGDTDAKPGTDPDYVQSTIANKPIALRLGADGPPRRVAVPRRLQREPVLTDAEASRIARTARRLEAALGAPQDIEWALGAPRDVDGVVGAPRDSDQAVGVPPDIDREAPDGDTIPDGGARRLFILQARPITALAEPAEGERRVWDNSNIVESFSGVTTPLTFSFARNVYEEVYLQFCRLMGVSATVLDRNRHVFRDMLGLIRGRVYYNLINWYRVLALLPGFSMNRGFMERMMGVSEKLEDPPRPPRSANRLVDAARVVRMLGRAAREHRRLKHGVEVFRSHVSAVLVPLRSEDFTTWPADRLIALYRRLERELLRRWQTPIVNDFFAMVWFGVLGRLADRWLADAGPAVVNDLLRGDGQVISTEPVRRIMALAGRVAESPRLRELLAREPDDEALWRRLSDDAAAGSDVNSEADLISEVDSTFDAEVAGFRAAIDSYLDRFGDRCVEELKLETISLAEEPAFLLRLIRGYAERGLTDPESGPGMDRTARKDAESLVRKRLGALRRAIFMAVLARARRRVRDRENLRFERTRVFGTLRRLFLGLGHDLARARRLDDSRAVFWLSLDELFAYAEDATLTADLRSLVDMRRAEFDAYRAGPPPPNRFVTHGPVTDAENGRAAVTSGPVADAETGRAAASSDPVAAAELIGIGCCAGVVSAPVVIVRDPREAPDLADRILVAERTDPGWTLLFPTAAGLLVERGSLLSHSAIVAREMGLPCIVAIPGLLDRVRHGDLIEMNGATGVARRIETDEGA